MTFIFDLLIGMLFISGISMAAVGLYARQFTARVPAATPFVLLMFCAAAWSVLYALDLLTASLPLRVFFHNLRFLFLPFFPVLELWLVLEYVNRMGWLRRDRVVLILIIPVIAAVLAITSPYHTLFRYGFSISTAGPVPVLQYSESAFFAVYSLYSLAILALAVILLVTESRKRGTLWEMSTILLVMALAFPTVLNYVLQFFQFPSPGINLTPAILWVAAILYAVALFRYRFLDIIPIARSRLIEISSKPVMVLSTEGRIIDMNPAAGALLSVSPASALGMPVSHVVSDWPEFLSLCRSGSAPNRDLARTDATGTHYYIGSAEPLTARDGTIEGRLIFLENVTGLKQAEAALRESEEKYRAIIDEMQDIFYRTDLAGKITMLSPSAARRAGYDSIDQIIGQDVMTVYADPAGRDGLLTALRKHGAVDAYPLTLRTLDGSIRLVTASSHFYRDVSGNILGVEGVIHDVTDQRQAENALMMANKKLNLLANITRHDIRNQLTALRAYLQLSGDAANNPTELAGYLEQEKKITETIERQIEFTRDYEEMGVNAPVWQSVDTCISKAIADLPLKNIRIETGLPGLEVFADPLLEKVFYNLIDNALRYGGEHMTTIRISTHAAGANLTLVFEDDGTGIAAGDKTRLFGKGFGKNTGLGLFLSREILSITGITIAETGITGKGARFEMTIPSGGFRFIKPGN